MKDTIKRPDIPLGVRAYRSLFSGPTAGVLFAALSARAGPKVVDRLLPGLGSGWPAVVGSAVVGFGAGFTSQRMASWTRMELVRKLLSYKEWMFHPTATKTKIWGFLLKVLVGPGPHSTYEFQAALPSLPLPELEDTCERYLESVMPLLTEAEYEHTSKLVKDFLENEGPQLQKYLKKRKKTMRNWMADWWLASAYLLKRESIAIDVNFFMISEVEPSVTTDALARSANCIYEMNVYYQMIQKRSLPPDMILDMIPVCMDGARFMFGSCRMPGEHVDTLEITPDSRHIIIVHKGNFFSMNLYEEGDKRKLRPISKREIKNQLQKIVTQAKKTPRVNNVAALTAQDRPTWAKHRQMLLANPVNKATVRAIETSQFVIHLGDRKPKNFSEQTHMGLCGDGASRWFDKAMLLESFDMTTGGGANMEHSGCDATHYAMMWEHVMQKERYGADGDVVDTPGQPVRDLPDPQRMHWQLDDMNSIIDKAYTDYKQRVDNMDSVAIRSEYGKSWMKKHRVSPDGYLQMAIQLTQWRLHKKFVKTYEPASHRLFLLGRTENINPVSKESINFVHLMEDAAVSREDKIQAMRKGIQYQSDVRLLCTAGYGCERHMLGLSMAARELGMDIPEIFTDKAFRLPMKLSTSQVPNQIGSVKSAVVPESVNGGFGPACHEGYGLLYIPMGDYFNFSITSWADYPETNSSRFGEGLKQAMRDMKAMMDGDTPNKPNGNSNANL